MSNYKLIHKYAIAQDFLCNKFGHSKGLDLTIDWKNKIVGKTDLCDAPDEKIKKLLNSLRTLARGGYPSTHPQPLQKKTASRIFNKQGKLSL